mgnify:FL=1
MRYSVPKTRRWRGWSITAIEPTQYVSIRYTEHLATAGLTASVGSAGEAYDNALAETVNGLYQTELIYARPAWTTVTEVEFETMNWVHWWNTT